jgi:hypothetical protein
MKIRNPLSGEIFDAELSTDHPASSNGQAVVIVDGVAVVEPLGMEVIELTLDELEVLPPEWTTAVLLGTHIRTTTE